MSEAEKVRNELFDNPTVSNEDYGRLVEEAAEADEIGSWEFEKDEDYEPQEAVYEIRRYYQEDNKPYDVIRSCITLEEAQEHCNREDTKGEGWFDGWVRLWN